LLTRSAFCTAYIKSQPIIAHKRNFAEAAPAAEKKAGNTPDLSKAPAAEKKAGNAPATEKKAGNAPDLSKAPAAEKKADNTPDISKAPATEKKAGNAPDLSKAPAHLQAIVNQIAGLNILEVAELTKLLQEKLGIAGAPMMSPMMMGGGGAAPAAAPAAEKKEEKKEKTEFSVRLVKVADGAKYKIIKELREIKPTLSLMETKALVEKLPSSLGDNLKKDDAEKIAKKIKDAGGEVDVV